MSRRTPDFDLTAAIADTGFTPGARDVPALLDLLASAPPDVRDHAERALRRVGAPAVPLAMERAKGATPEARGRFVALAGRIAGAESPPELRAFLLEALRDPEASVRRRAAVGLGRAHPAPKTPPAPPGSSAPLAASPEADVQHALAASPEADVQHALAGDPGAAVKLASGRVSGEIEVQQALAEAAVAETDPAVRAAIVEALGKLGGPAAQKTLAALEEAGATGDVKTSAALRKARVRVGRPAAREEGSRVDVTRSPAAPLRVWLDTRRGMLPILVEEAAALRPRMEHRLDGSAVAAVDLRGPLATLFAARTWISVALPGGVVERLAPKQAAGEAFVAAVARAIVSGPARAAVASLTQGPVRYRLSFAGGGKRRASVFAIAEAVTALDPALVNDPTDATWQIEVREQGERVAIEWAPSLDDPRFAYRGGDVPAASHPAIAAALAYLAGAKPDDVVWDPFVGSGLELCERSLRGPYARLVGTDLDPAALEIARKNLTACGADRVDLRAHDAELGAPRGVRPTLVITNPPMGRRVHRSADLRTFLCSFVTRVARSLAPGGRFVWVSPFGADTRAAAEAAGLHILRGHIVDMGGFDAEIQVWMKED